MGLIPGLRLVRHRAQQIAPREFNPRCGSGVFADNRCSFPHPGRTRSDADSNLLVFESSRVSAPQWHTEAVTDTSRIRLRRWQSIRHFLLLGMARHARNNQGRTRLFGSCNEASLDTGMD